MAQFVIQCNQLITGLPNKERMHTSFLAVDHGKVTAVGLGNGDAHITEETEVLSLAKDDVLVPGFVDLHIHGAYGADVMDGTKEALQTMANNLPAEGTTSFLATTITQEYGSIKAAIEQTATYRGNEGEADISGLHIEGPFINEIRKGAQPQAFIGDPSIKTMEEWVEAGKGLIKQMTFAPEKPGGLELTHYLRSQNINPSIGHSDAVFEEVEAAVAAGVNQVTHMFNGMRPLHHREPGVAGSALLFDELDIELIVDGIHIHPQMVKLAWKTKGTNQCLLITDSMRAKGLPNGSYELGGQKVEVANGKATLTADGTLAGSVLKMNDAVANMCSFTGCLLEEAIQMASYNPAKKAGLLDRKGSLEKGKDADFTVIRESGEVILTYCNGKESYRREGFSCK